MRPTRKRKEGKKREGMERVDLSTKLKARE